LKIKKGTKLLIVHSRKGKFKAIALKTFNTSDDSYPVAVLEGQVGGLSTSWVAGEQIPCGGSLCSLTLLT